ncbi:MAG: hypothetical protein WBV27_02215, partial [Trichococcus sp.]|uniref:hypothetical protein n=1 Tax=Trichococcus sp. TaxID=1985464 RepID=UPI003C62CA11
HDTADVCVRGADVQAGVADGHKRLLPSGLLSVGYLFTYHSPMAAMLCMDYYTQSCGSTAIRMLQMKVSTACGTVLGIRPTTAENAGVGCSVFFILRSADIPRRRRLFSILHSSFSQHIVRASAVNHPPISVKSTHQTLVGSSVTFVLRSADIHAFLDYTAA